MRRAVLAASAALIALSSGQAFAWGEEGHQIVVLLANERLSPAAKAQVADLLETPDAESGLVKYASWADDVAHNGREDTKPWHFVDIQIENDGYDAGRDCVSDEGVKDACLVAQLDKEIAAIKDQSQPKATRSEALKFLIHFVGDMHQPMHCADNHNKGGNNVSVKANGKLSNMHRVWDTAVVNAIGTDAKKVSAMISPIISPALQTQWAAGTPENWINECFVIAKKQVYEAVPGMINAKIPLDLSDKYPAQVGPITASQLAKAGVRLAFVLNAALEPQAAAAVSGAAAPSAPAPAH